jgi:SHS2 domain-containing protein
MKENKDIKGNNNYSPKGPISCIIQSNNEEKILAGCWDGLIYSMDFDKIIYFLIKLEKLSNSFKIFFHKK